jgi:hypothetical protein
MSTSTNAPHPAAVRNCFVDYDRVIGVGKRKPGSDLNRSDEMYHRVASLTWLLSLGGYAFSAEPPEEPAQAVVAAVRREATRNAKLPAKERLTGDALTELYIRSAATAARKLPADQAIAGFLVGVGIALDDSEILRSNPVTAALCKRIESDAERKERLAVLGSPSMRGRRDLCQHFVVSCALTQVVGPTLAETAGLLKEQKDSQDGTGFSFIDMLANLSGIHLGKQLKKGNVTLAQLETKFRVTGLLPDIMGLREDMQAADFAKLYGGFGDKRFLAEMERLRKRIRKLPPLE